MVQNENKILLHACCAICSGYPISLLKEMGYEVSVYFCNSNLDSADEFNRRLEAQKIVCDYLNVPLIVEEYNPQEYLEYIKGLESEPEKGLRCIKCIELRLKKTFEKSKEFGFKYFTTSLTISPHKNFDLITKTGLLISENYLPINFRKQDGFLKTNRLSKDLNLYRQNYCGCSFAKK